MVDLIEAAATEAHSKQARLYFSSTCPPCERLKQTPEEEARGKRFWKHYEKTGEFLVSGSVPTTRVAGLIDVIDEDEELNYLDDDTPATASKEKSPALKTIEAINEPVASKGESSGLEARDPIDLDFPEAEKPAADQSRSPPPALKDDGGSVMEISEGNTASPAKDTRVLQLEKAGALFDLSLCFSFLL
jgi:hypothetical protein